MATQTMETAASTPAGLTRIRASAPPLLASACHCTGCQRMTASAFSLTLSVPSEGFAVTSGDPVIAGLHERQKYP
jgi:hypothetical protein